MDVSRTRGGRVQSVSSSLTEVPEKCSSVSSEGTQPAGSPCEGTGNGDHHVNKDLCEFQAMLCPFAP